MEAIELPHLIADRDVGYVVEGSIFICLLGFLRPLLCRRFLLFLPVVKLVLQGEIRRENIDAPVCGVVCLT